MADHDLADRRVRTGPRLLHETQREYIQRVVRNAGRPTDEQVARLAALLGYTKDASSTERCKASATAEGKTDG